MALLLLGGYGNGNWLPVLGLLMLIGIGLQLVDWSFKYMKRRRRRKLYELEQSIINQPYHENSLDNFSGN
jgi:hypothetical protein